MNALEIYTTHTGPLKVNTYILHDAHSAAIVDPGGNEKRLLLWLKENGLQLNKILLTHGHFDHCGAVHALKAATGAQIIISAADEEMLHNNVLSMAHAFGVSCPPCYADRCVSHGDTVSLGFTNLEVISTPGHTPGGVCYYTDGILFSGDTLFAGSVGRSDFPGGDYDALIESVKKRLFVLPDGTHVLPGHGDATTIGQEKSDNPFLGYGWDK